MAYGQPLESEIVPEATMTDQQRQADTVFRQQFGRPSLLAAAAPGRVNLIGESGACAAAGFLAAGGYRHASQAGGPNQPVPDFFQSGVASRCRQA